MTQEFLPYNVAADQAWGAYETIEGADLAADTIAADARALLEKLRGNLHATLKKGTPSDESNRRNSASVIKYLGSFFPCL